MAMDALEQLAAKQEISEVIARYARAIDRLDEALLRSVFHPGSRHRHFYEGPSSDPDAPSSPGQPGDFVAFAFDELGVSSRTHHQMGIPLIELDGDHRAYAETYFTAFHRLRAASDPLAGPGAFDTEMDYFVGGRYIDSFALRDGCWKITARTGMTDWTRMEAPVSQGFFGIDAETLGRRSPDDFIYRHRDQ